MEKIHPRKDETYWIDYDDKCLLIKGHDNKMVHISKAMANWIALNFADKTNVDIKFV